MGRLIQSEFLKLKRSMGYKILLLCSAGTGLLLSILVATVGLELELDGFHIYMEAIGEFQTQLIYACIFAGVFIGNEFNNRTFGMGIISGCSRHHLLTAKVFVFCIGLIVLELLFPLTAVLVTSVFHGFGVLTMDIAFSLIRTTLLAILGYTVTGGFCIMLSILIRNIGGIIGAAIGIAAVSELLSMALNALPMLGGAGKFLFPYQLAMVAGPESVPMFVVVCIISLIVMAAVSFMVFDRTELK